MAGRNANSTKITSTQRPGSRLLRTGFVWLRRLALGLVALAACGVLVYAVAPVPITPYMIAERARLGKLDYDWTPMSRIAPAMQLSAVAAEDANFCAHWGFDIGALREAINGGMQRGGSTISQQVVKNVFLWQARSWPRKALEGLLVVPVEMVWSKRRILEVYLNIAEFDEGVFGVGEAINGGMQRGGSTISQQVVKNVFLWQSRSWPRKALEGLLVVPVEVVWSKRRILEVYLNIAEFDEGVFGVGAAARHYFGVAAADLSPTQAARLAAVLPDPKDRSASKPSSYVKKRAGAIIRAGPRRSARTGGRPASCAATRVEQEAAEGADHLPFLGRDRLDRGASSSPAPSAPAGDRPCSRPE